MVWTTRKKGSEKRSETCPKFLKPSRHLKISHRHFSKSLSPRKICTTKSSCFTARLCRTSHAFNFRDEICQKDIWKGSEEEVDTNPWSGDGRESPWKSLVLIWSAIFEVIFATPQHIFYKIAWGQKHTHTHKMIIECAKNRLKPP